MNGLDELRALLEKNNVSFEIIQNKKPIYSVNDAIGYYEISQTAPTLIIKTERGFFALILAGDRGRIDFELVKASLQCEKAKLASKNEVLEITGYDAGSVPLVGHGLSCIVDSRLFSHSCIYGGAGDANFTLKIDPRDIEKINAVVAKIV